jgi:D-amino-acid oxidase
MAEILVLGAGVVGLSSALRLARETKHRVTVWAKDLTKSASQDAAAFWWPWRADGEQHMRWSLESLEHFRKLDDHAGVINRKIISLAQNHRAIPSWCNVVPSCRYATESEVTEALPNGIVIEGVPVIDPFVYLDWLKKRLKEAGVKIEVRQVENLQEALKEYSIVINCTGTAARDLCGDDQLQTVGGEFIKVRGIVVKSVIFTGESDDSRFVVPQGYYTMIGGTHPANSPAIIADQKDAVAMIDIVKKLSQNVKLTQNDIIGGARATYAKRPSIRLEVERVSGGHIIHNYGYGGSGYTLAYGCAGEVVRLSGDLS